MPYCKSVAIHGHVDKTLKYILDPDKTEELLYTSSINCMTEADLSYAQMKTVYEQYSRRSYDAPPSKSGKSPVKAIHYIISFADSENVTPELAHKIAKALVRKNFGEDAQAVIATHTNTDHVHCHILVNSYSISGQRFYDNKKSIRIVRENTNGVCRAFGVTPALNFEDKGRSISHYEWECKKKGISWKEHIRNTIDSLIPAVSTLDDFLAELERHSYSIKRDKHIYIKAPGQQRSVSLWRLDEDYTEESLNSRILWRMVGGGNGIEHFSNTAIERAYISVIGEVRILASENRKVQRRVNPNAPYAVDDVLDIYKLSAQLTVINRDKIMSIEDLKYRIDKHGAEYIALKEQFSQKLLDQEELQEMIRQSEFYFANVDKTDLSAEDRNRLEIYKSSMQANDIHSPDDIDYWRERNSKLQSDIKALKNTLTDKKNKLAMYTDIRDTYYEISRGDYISKLVEEEKQRREQERQKELQKAKKKKGSR